MRMVRPRVTGADQIYIAQDQEEYLTVTAALVEHPQGKGVLLAFEPSAEERQRIAAGDDFYIALLTFGGPMQPIVVMCGKEEAAASFGLGVET